MDGCFAFWRIGCRIDWEAWAAIGSMLAVFVAVGASIFNQRHIQRERAKINKVIIYQIHFELKRIYNVATWCLDLYGSVQAGRLPENYSPAIKLAVTDLRKLETPVFDTYGQEIPGFDSFLASTVIAAYATIKKNVGHIARHVDQYGLIYDQKNFDELCRYASDLQAGTAIAVTQSAKYSGLDTSTALQCGPQSYSTLAQYQ